MLNRAHSWQEKIYAFLHDPPHKLTVSFYYHRGHEKVAQEITRMILPEYPSPTQDIVTKIHQADHLASALCRLIVEQFDKPINTIDEHVNEDDMGKNSIIQRILKEIQTTGRVLCLDPWTSIPPNGEERGLRLKIPLKRAIKLIHKIIKNSVDQTHKDELLFHLLFRIFPELLYNMVNGQRRYVMLDFPADTRAPNHSLFEHLIETSALYRCLPNPGLLLFTLGPVQSFIAISRKTADLFGSSYLLSYLVWKGIQEIVETYGPDHLIYPSMFRQGLYDHYLLSCKFQGNEELQKQLTRKKYSYKWHRLIRVPNMPNRFLAFVPFSEHDDASKNGFLEERLVNKVQNSWTHWVLTALRMVVDLNFAKNESECKQSFQDRIKIYLEMDTESLQDVANENTREWLARCLKQAESLFRIHASIIPLTCKTDDSQPSLFGSEALDFIIQTYQQMHGPETQDLPPVQLVNLLKDYPAYKKILSITTAYPLVTEVLERWHRANREHLSPYQGESPDRGRLCSLCGERVEIGNLWAQLHEMDTFSDWNASRFVSLNQKADQFWSKIRRPPENVSLKGIPVLIGQNERLCTVCFTKRLFPLLLEQELNRNLVKDGNHQDKKKISPIYIRRFPSTREIASILFKRTLLQGLITLPPTHEVFSGDIITGLRKKLKEGKDRFGFDYQTYIIPHFLFDLNKNNLDSLIRDNLKKLMKIESHWLEDNPEFLEDLDIPKEKRKDLNEWYQHDYLPVLKRFIEEWKNSQPDHKPYPTSSRYYALGVMDGDRMGQFLKGHSLKKVLDYLHPEAKQFLENIPETKPLAKINHPLIPAWQTALSRRLGEFSGRIITEIFYEKWDAQLVYAGGDDVMFMAPTENALSIANVIRDEFRKTVLREGDMSAGIIFAHEKIPLHIVLDQARKAEQSAKERGRSAFEIRVIKHSGDLLITGFHWEYEKEGSPIHTEKILKDYLTALKNGNLSSRFCYRLAELYHNAGLMEGEADNNKQHDLAKTLLNFEFRQVMAEKDKDSKTSLDYLLKQLERLLDITRSPKDFLNALLCYSFVLRQESP